MFDALLGHIYFHIMGFEENSDPVLVGKSIVGISLKHNLILETHML